MRELFDNTSLEGIRVRLQVGKRSRVGEILFRSWPPGQEANRVFWHGYILCIHCL